MSVSSTVCFSFKYCSPKPLTFYSKKPSGLQRRNISSTTHWPPACHCGFFHFLPTFVCPITSHSRFKIYLYCGVIHNKLRRRKSWYNGSLLLSKICCKRGCWTKLILYLKKSKRAIHDRFWWSLYSKWLSHFWELAGNMTICLSNELDDRSQKIAFMWFLLLLWWCNPHTKVSTDELLWCQEQRITQGKCHYNLWY